MKIFKIFVFLWLRLKIFKMFNTSKLKVVDIFLYFEGEFSKFSAVWIDIFGVPACPFPVGYDFLHGRRLFRFWKGSDRGIFFVFRSRKSYFSRVRFRKLSLRKSVAINPRLRVGMVVLLPKKNLVVYPCFVKTVSKRSTYTNF